jgi:hypothetical protein
MRHPHRATGQPAAAPTADQESRENNKYHRPAIRAGGRTPWVVLWGSYKSEPPARGLRARGGAWFLELRGLTGRPVEHRAASFRLRDRLHALLLRSRRHGERSAARIVQRLGAGAPGRRDAAEGGLPEVPVARGHGQIHEPRQYQRLRRAGALYDPHHLALRQPRGRSCLYRRDRPAVRLLQRRHRCFFPNGSQQQQLQRPVQRDASP